MPYYPIRGGREEFVHRLATSLAKRGHEVDVLAPALPGLADPPNRDDDAAFTVTRVELGGLFLEGERTDLPAAVEATAARFREARPDVVHAHNLGPDLMVLRQAMSRAGVTAPITLTVHGLASTIDPGRWSIARYAERAVDIVVAVSEVARDEVARRAPRLQQRLVLVRNGVPIPVDAPAASPDARDLLVMGRLSTEKGVAALLVAFSVLVAGDRSWRLVVAGDGPDRAGLERLATHLGVADRVVFTGWLDQERLAAQLRDSLLVVVPSVWDEPFGLAAAEAQAAGRAVLASRVGALPEIVVDAETGWLVPPGDPLALAAILRAVAEDPTVAVTHGARARERAAREFDWETCVHGYERVYRDTIRSGGR
jgi:glycosyltransferase involved in cell wall biosynthesis